MDTTERILITPGEPAGIGADITIQIAQEKWPHELVVISDPGLLIDRAKQLHLPLTLLEVNLQSKSTPHQSGTLKIIPVPLPSKAVSGKLNSRHAEYVLNTLEQAAAACQNQLAGAIVTGPVHKGMMNDAGIPFTGHTEFFATYCHVEQTVMLFVVNKIKVALATTHLPLKEVPSAITSKRLQTTLAILNKGLKEQFNISSPRILVCGLNPHAGEEGYLGREEIDLISPLLNNLRKQGHLFDGPLAADTVFTAKYLEKADAILAMYHDQALPLVKYIGFGHAVNMTLGLPFIRTSVDHGTALDVAGSGKADAGSMKAAIELTCSLLQNRHR